MSPVPVIEDADRRLQVAADSAVARASGTSRVVCLGSGERRLRRALATLEPRATTSVWSHATMADEASLEAAHGLIRSSRARGVDVQVRVDHAGMPRTLPSSLADDRRGYGSGIRPAVVYRPWLLVDDAALVWLQPDADLGVTGWLVSDPVAVRAATRLRRVTERTADLAEQGITARQDAVMSLLLEGLTDDAVAQRLGVSRRTVTGDLRDLCVVLGARGRIDLGYRWASRTG